MAVEGEAQREPDADRGQGVEHVVAAGDRQLDPRRAMRRAAPRWRTREAAAAGVRLEVDGREVGLRREAVGDDAAVGEARQDAAARSGRRGRRSTRPKNGTRLANCDEGVAGCRRGRGRCRGGRGRSLVITAMTGVRRRKLRSNSSASATRYSLWPRRAPVPERRRRPPTITVGSSPASVSMVPTSEVVVVLPWVPATAMPYLQAHQLAEHLGAAHHGDAAPPRLAHLGVVLGDRRGDAPPARRPRGGRASAPSRSATPSSSQALGRLARRQVAAGHLEVVARAAAGSRRCRSCRRRRCRRSGCARGR